MKEEKIIFKSVSAGYGKKKILANLNFTISEGDFIGMVGPNGSGKTTLLKTLIGTLKPVEGKVTREDVRFGYVPQRDVVQPLLPYTVFDVVMMGRYSLLGVFGNPGKQDVNIVEESLNSVGISHLKDYNYNSLSGGQRQRTLIARALAVQPNLLILDEPTNGMDTPSHYSLLELIRELHDDQHLTIVLVSHLLSDVANVVKKIMLIEQNYFQYGGIDDILSEENLKKTYSTEFTVNKIDDEYLITTKHKE